MPKPPNTLLASSGCLHHLWSSSTVSTSTPLSTRIRRSPKHNARSLLPYHTDATSSQPPDDLSWPRSHPSTDDPTPYEILKQHPSAPYSKRQFYELVKIYHPDRSSNSCNSVPSLSSSYIVTTSSLPYSVRLHRYRLIIQAHTILSDPVKRAAYDRYGAGWAGQPAVDGLSRAKGERGWRTADSPANCATWEDWEAWHQWRYEKEHAGSNGKHRREPVYVSNGGFVVLIVLFTVAGTAHEISRAGRLSQSFVQQLEQVHDETSKGLNKSRTESRLFDDKDKRVQRFLKERRAEPALAAAIAEKEGPAGDGQRFPGLLPETEICQSADMQKRRLGNS